MHSFTDDRGWPVEINPHFADGRPKHGAKSRLRIDPTTLSPRQRTLIGVAMTLAGAALASSNIYWSVRENDWNGIRIRLALLGGGLAIAGVMAAFARRFAPTRWTRQQFPFVARTIRSGLCASCGYRLTALEPGPDGAVQCAECGAAWDPELWRRDWRYLDLPAIAKAPSVRFQFAPQIAPVLIPEIESIGRVWLRQNVPLTGVAKLRWRWAIGILASIAFVATCLALRVRGSDDAFTFLAIPFGVFAAIGCFIGCAAAPNRPTINALQAMIAAFICPCCGQPLRPAERGRGWAVCDHCWCLCWPPASATVPDTVQDSATDAASPPRPGPR